MLTAAGMLVFAIGFMVFLIAFGLWWLAVLLAVAIAIALAATAIVAGGDLRGRDASSPTSSPSAPGRHTLRDGLDDHEQRSGLADAAGRAALFPARAAARAWRDQLEAAVDEVLSAPESARVIDRALAGSCRRRPCARSCATASWNGPSPSWPRAGSSTGWWTRRSRARRCSGCSGR